MRDAYRWDGKPGTNQGYDGLSPNITTVAKKLKDLNYKTHVVGKQDGFGMATLQHIATSELRGFDTSLGYFEHANSPYNYTIGPGSVGAQAPCDDPYYIDLMFNEGSDIGSVKRSKYYNCSFTNPEQSCQFEDDVLVRRALDIVEEHDID